MSLISCRKSRKKKCSRGALLCADWLYDAAPAFGLGLRALFWADLGRKRNTHGPKTGPQLFGPESK